MNTDIVTTGELFELLTKATRDAVWNWNLETNTIWWNEGYTTLFGYNTQGSVENAIESWVDHIHPDDKDHVLSSIHQVIDEGGANWSDEYRFQRIDGSYATVYDRGYVLYRDGKPLRMVGAMQDITERVALQQAHRESEERLRFALQSAQLGTWELDLLRGTVNWDSRCQEICGLTGEDSRLYKQTLDYIHPDDRSRVEEAVQWALNPQSGGHYDTSFRTISDRQVRWVRFIGKTHFSETGEAHRFSGVAEDITEKVLAKEKTALAEQQARIALEGSGSGSFFIKIGSDNEVESDILYSPSFARILTGEESTGLNWRVFIEQLHPDDRLIREQAHRIAIQTGTISYEARFIWNDGTIHWIKILGQYLFNVNGEPVSVSGIAFDITEQVVARRAIDESELRFQTLMEAIAQMTWANTPQGEINFYNQRWYDYTGLDFEQTKAWGWQAVVHPDDLPNMLDQYTKALTDGTIFVVENRYRRGSDGMYRWHLNRALPIRDEAGQITLWVGTATDIHEQKLLATELEHQVQARTEQLMASNHDLRRSNENLEKFAYVASHDLQEPLRKIQSFGDLLKSQYATELGEGINHLERMQNAASRMSMLIKDLLTFSRISTRQEATRPVALNHVVAGVLGDLEVAIQQTKAQIEVDTLPTVPGDESQWRQLFQNLLSNALKFQKPGTMPVIRVQTERIQASAIPLSVRPSRLAKAYHQISVADNGIGFDEKYIDRIFQVFQRLHSRNEYAGTGIGLAICEKVVANHGGAITAFSKPGEGATFTIYLPVV